LILFYKLHKVRPLKRFLLSLAFFLFLFELTDFGFILSAYVKGYIELTNSPLIYPDSIWFIQTLSRNLFIILVSLVVIRNYITKDKFKILFIIAYGMINAVISAYSPLDLIVVDQTLYLISAYLIVKRRKKVDNS